MTHDTKQNPQQAGSSRWRTVDIIVAAVLGVAFGIIFFAWNNLWSSTSWAFVAFPPAQGILYGMWLLPGVLGGLVIRKPGAAVFTSTVAATVSVFFGAPTPLEIILYGAGQGFLAELVFAVFRYRRWTIGVALLAGMVAGLGPGILDPIRFYPTWPGDFKTAWLAIVVTSGMIIAGLGSWLLLRALRPTGVLAPFASGQQPSAQ